LQTSRLKLNGPAVAALLLCAFLLASFTVFSKDISAQDHPRVSEVCLDCHDSYDAGLASTAHRLSDELDGPNARVTCTDCHVGDKRHWEDDPEEYAMANPAEADASATSHLCSACHLNAHQQNILEKNVHAANDVNCSGCHSVHGSAHMSLLKDEEPTLCLGCHASVEGQFARPYRHPVNDEIIKCSECHMTLDVTGTELSINGSNACYECHAQFEGPFPYEHQATVDYSTEEGACITCHDPHGSYLPKMLKQPYEYPHFQLCTQCHSVPLHNQSSFHGNTWAGVPCNDCHTDVHGSYVSRNLLSETLEDEGCFNPGCHQF
jgi:DmsE family decaheme c-type cytochrome